MSCAEGDTGFVYEGARPFDVERRRSVGDSAGRATKIMMNVGNPGRSVRAVVHSERRRRPRAHRVHHQHAIGVHPMALVRYAQLGGQARAEVDRLDGGLHRQAGVLRRQARRGRRHDRRGVLSEGRHRPAQRLQDERVRAARGRRGVRAGRRESDDRIPRRLALLRRPLSAKASRSSAAR